MTSTARPVPEVTRAVRMSSDWTIVEFADGAVLSLMGPRSKREIAAYIPIAYREHIARTEAAAAREEYLTNNADEIRAAAAAARARRAALNASK